MKRWKCFEELRQESLECRMSFLPTSPHCRCSAPSGFCRGDLTGLAGGTMTLLPVWELLWPTKHARVVCCQYILHLCSGQSFVSRPRILPFMSFRETDLYFPAHWPGYYYKWEGNNIGWTAGSACNLLHICPFHGCLWARDSVRSFSHLQAATLLIHPYVGLSFRVLNIFLYKEYWWVLASDVPLVCGLVKWRWLVSCTREEISINWRMENEKHLKKGRSDILRSRVSLLCRLIFTGKNSNNDNNINNNGHDEKKDNKNSKCNDKRMSIFKFIHSKQRISLCFCKVMASQYDPIMDLLLLWPRCRIDRSIAISLR